MTKKTGNPRGRPRGPAKRKPEDVKVAMHRVMRAVSRAVPGAFDGDAHAFLIAVYKDPAHPVEVRLDAAKAAVKFEKPSLASIDVTSTNEHIIHDVSADPEPTLDAWESTASAPH